MGLMDAIKGKESWSHFLTGKFSDKEIELHYNDAKEVVADLEKMLKTTIPNEESDVVSTIDQLNSVKGIDLIGGPFSDYSLDFKNYVNNLKVDLTNVKNNLDADIERIQEYSSNKEDIPFGKQVLKGFGQYYATNMMTSLAVSEGAISLLGELGDCALTIGGWIGGKFNPSFKDKMAKKIEAEPIHDFYSNFYNVLDPYSAFTGESGMAGTYRLAGNIGASIFSGELLGKVFTAGSKTVKGYKAAKAAAEAAIAATSTTGAVTESGLQAGEDFDKASAKGAGWGAGMGALAGGVTYLFTPADEALKAINKGAGATDDVAGGAGKGTAKEGENVAKRATQQGDEAARGTGKGTEEIKEYTSTSSNEVDDLLKHDSDDEMNKLIADRQKALDDIEKAKKDLEGPEKALEDAKNSKNPFGKKERIEKAQGEVDKAGKELRTNEAQLQKVDDDISVKLASDTKDTVKEIDEAEKKLYEAQKKLDNAQNRRNPIGKRGKVKDAQQQVTDAEMELETKKAQYTIKNNQYDAQEARVALQNAENELESAQNALKKVETGSKPIAKELDDARKLVDDKTKIFEKAKTKYDEVVGEAKGWIDDASKQLDNAVTTTQDDALRTATKIVDKIDNGVTSTSDEAATAATKAPTKLEKVVGKVSDQIDNVLTGTSKTSIAAQGLPAAARRINDEEFSPSGLTGGSTGGDSVVPPGPEIPDYTPIPAPGGTENPTGTETPSTTTTTTENPFKTDTTTTETPTTDEFVSTPYNTPYSPGTGGETYTPTPAVTIPTPTTEVEEPTEVESVEESEPEVTTPTVPIPTFTIPTPTVTTPTITTPATTTVQQTTGGYTGGGASHYGGGYTASEGFNADDLLEEVTEPELDDLEEDGNTIDEIINGAKTYTKIPTSSTPINKPTSTKKGNSFIPIAAGLSAAAAAGLGAKAYLDHKKNNDNGEEEEDYEDDWTDAEDIEIDEDQTSYHEQYLNDDYNNVEEKYDAKTQDDLAENQ